MVYACARALVRATSACLLQQLRLPAFIRAHQCIEKAWKAQFGRVVLSINRSQLAQHGLREHQNQQCAEAACFSGCWAVRGGAAVSGWVHRPRKHRTQAVQLAAYQLPMQAVPLRECKPVCTRMRAGASFA